MFYIKYKYTDEYDTLIEGMFFTTSEEVAKKKVTEFYHQFRDEKNFEVFIEKCLTK